MPEPALVLAVVWFALVYGIVMVAFIMVDRAMVVRAMQGSVRMTVKVPVGAAERFVDYLDPDPDWMFPAETNPVRDRRNGYTSGVSRSRGVVMHERFSKLYDDLVTRVGLVRVERATSDATNVQIAQAIADAQGDLIEVQGMIEVMTDAASKGDTSDFDAMKTRVGMAVARQNDALALLGRPVDTGATTATAPPETTGG